MTTYGRNPINIISGAGCTITDDTGKTYLDIVAGIATFALGHALLYLPSPSCTK